MAYNLVRYRDLVLHLSTMLRQTFSDKTISDQSIMFWVIAGVNSIKRDTIERGPKTGSYLSTFTNITSVINYTGSNNFLRNRKYIELPANILDLTNDKAIDWINYYPSNDGSKRPIPLERSTYIEIQEMEHNPHEKPAPDQPYYFRMGKLLYTAGLEKYPKVPFDMGLYTSVNPRVTGVDWDDELQLNDEQVGKVISYCVGLGSFILQIPGERREEGADTRQSIPLKPDLQNSDGQ